MHRRKKKRKQAEGSVYKRQISPRTCHLLRCFLLLPFLLHLQLLLLHLPSALRGAVEMTMFHHLLFELLLLWELPVCFPILRLQRSNVILSVSRQAACLVYALAVCITIGHKGKSFCTNINRLLLLNRFFFCDVFYLVFTAAVKSQRRQQNPSSTHHNRSSCVCLCHKPM